MKKYITAAQSNKSKPLSFLSEEAINALPDMFLCYTHVPGGNFGNIFKIMSKEAYLKKSG